MICGGIDGGSRAIKAVVMDSASGEVLASGIRDQGVDHDRLATELFLGLLGGLSLGRRDVGRIVATGYTRSGIRLADTTVTEITCHAIGTRHLVTDAATVIDIGGQDSKLIRLSPDGAVRDFAMNDRCAAGTGRFLEVVAARLEVDLAELGTLAAGSTSPAAISSMCVVFAETEIIGLLASGASPQDIVAGVHASLTQRVAAMAGRRVEEPIVFTGGVAMIPGMDKALSAALGHPVNIAPNPQFTGALGAALLAARQCHASA
jgi:predicted CoA-substrate-specific enzyme activase